MGQKQLDYIWREWLSENLKNNCDPYDLYNKLLANGFSEASIMQEMGGDYPPGWEIISDEDEARYKTFSTTRITQNDNGLNVLKVETNRFQIYTLDDFLSEAECDEVVEMILPYLRPSTVTRENNDKAYRTSATSDMVLMTQPREKDMVARLDEKISRTIGIQRPYSEGIQAQRYLVGQEFKKHTDFFQPGTEEYKKHAGKRGQRTWTFVVYLNSVTKGGGTKFFALDKVFSPLRGRAVIWNNLHPDGSGNIASVHAGLPVEEGEKIIITKWFRARGTGPLLYD